MKCEFSLEKWRRLAPINTTLFVAGVHSTGKKIIVIENIYSGHLYSRSAIE